MPRCFLNRQPHAWDFSALAGGCFVLFHRQIVLTAERVKKMLGTIQSELGTQFCAADHTHQRAMLNPQMDFISRQVALDVPIH